MSETDLKIEPTPTRSSGGQCVGVIANGVKVTHVPTGLSATCEAERSQLKNKRVAVSMIEWGLAEIEWREPNE